jgi:hypothetical protein
MPIKHTDIRPEDDSPSPDPTPAPTPSRSFPWWAVVLAAAAGALLGTVVTALALLGRVPGGAGVGAGPTENATVTAAEVGPLVIDWTTQAFATGVPL